MPDLGDWRETLIEVEPGVYKRATDCTEAEAIAGLANQEEIMALRARYRTALSALRSLTLAGSAVPLPAGFAFEAEIWNINLLSLRERVPQIERLVEVPDVGHA